MQNFLIAGSDGLVLLVRVNLLYPPSRNFIEIIHPFKMCFGQALIDYHRRDLLDYHILDKVSVIESLCIVSTTDHRNHLYWKDRHHKAFLRSKLYLRLSIPVSIPNNYIYLWQLSSHT
jgi:hypothetical protein